MNDLRMLWVLMTGVILIAVSRSSLLVSQGKEINCFIRERDEAKKENQSLREVLAEVRFCRDRYDNCSIDDWDDLVKRINAALEKP